MLIVLRAEVYNTPNSKTNVFKTIFPKKYLDTILLILQNLIRKIILNVYR